MRERIQEMVNAYGFGISVEKLVSELYWKLTIEGADACIVNGRYLEVDGVNYQLKKTRSKGHWTVVEI